MRNLSTQSLQNTRGAKRNAWGTSAVVRFHTKITKCIQRTFSNTKYYGETAVLDDAPSWYVSFSSIPRFLAKTPNSCQNSSSNRYQHKRMTLWDPHLPFKNTIHDIAHEFG